MPKHEIPGWYTAMSFYDIAGIDHVAVGCVCTHCEQALLTKGLVQDSMGNLFPIEGRFSERPWWRFW